MYKCLVNCTIMLGLIEVRVKSFSRSIFNFQTCLRKYSVVDLAFHEQSREENSMSLSQGYT